MKDNRTRYKEICRKCERNNNMEFLLGLFLGYLLFSKNKEVGYSPNVGTRVVKCTTPLYKKPPRKD